MISEGRVGGSNNILLQILLLKREREEMKGPVPHFSE